MEINLSPEIIISYLNDKFLYGYRVVMKVIVRQR